MTYAGRWDVSRQDPSKGAKCACEVVGLDFRLAIPIGQVSTEVKGFRPVPGHQSCSTATFATELLTYVQDLPRPRDAAVIMKVISIRSTRPG